ncbi:hypothetical protein KKB55_08120 [Myxococcota bacterium]|nr:hypothetical protein [Myxococcota bacterium]MBU1897712.1 hypothetical protein [Myxococcota bacterium]
MSAAVACCHRGCTRAVWVREGEGFVVATDSATCLGCRRVALCFDHFIAVGGEALARCPHCQAQRWHVVLFERALSPAQEAEIKANGGRVEARQIAPQAPTPTLPWHLYLPAQSPKGAYALGPWLVWPVAGGARVSDGLDERFVAEGGVSQIAGAAGPLLLGRGPRGLAFLDEGRLAPLTLLPGRRQRDPVALGAKRFLFLEERSAGVDVWQVSFTEGRARSRRLGARHAPGLKLCAFGPGAALLAQPQPEGGAILERLSLESGARQRLGALACAPLQLQGGLSRRAALALCADGAAWIITEAAISPLARVEGGVLSLDEEAEQIAYYAAGAMRLVSLSGAPLAEAPGPRPLGLRWRG